MGPTPLPPPLGPQQSSEEAPRNCPLQRGAGLLQGNSTVLGHPPTPFPLDPLVLNAGGLFECTGAREAPSRKWREMLIPTTADHPHLKN